MRPAILAAALALTTAGAAFAQSAQGENERTGMGAQRTDKQDANQTYNTGETGSQVGGQTGGAQADTSRTDGMNAARTRDYDADRGARGTGVATGFIAAGLGLALLGLFVRRRNRRDHRYDDVNRPGGPGGIGPRV